MLKLVIFALLVASTLAARVTKSETQSAFVNWMHVNSKSYSHDEFQVRFQNFKNNVNFINKWNADKTHTHKVALNKFADLSGKEFAALYNGVRVPESYVHTATFQVDPSIKLPDSFDWRTQGAVTGIKNQGQCGSCWAFSTTGSVEACHFFGAKNLVGLSEQNLVDCSQAQGNQGCNGGLMTAAMDYIIANKGIDSESSYPYTAEDGNCQYAASNEASTETAYSNVASGDENALQQSVSKGPTSVAIDASQSSFQFYSSGVYSDPNCSSSQLDHGVLAVGWGSDSGQAYWIVKNSWGTDWGQSGYIWMARNDNNMCGIATMATLPQC
jgi:cathepsin L